MKQLKASHTYTGFGRYIYYELYEYAWDIHRNGPIRMFNLLLIKCLSTNWKGKHKCKNLRFLIIYLRTPTSIHDNFFIFQFNSGRTFMVLCLS